MQRLTIISVFSFNQSVMRHSLSSSIKEMAYKADGFKQKVVIPKNLSKIERTPLTHCQLTDHLNIRMA